MTKLRILLGANLLLLLVIGAFYLGPRFKSRPGNQICIQEAKLCPDGSSVSRREPNCEFAPCPAVFNDQVPNKINPSLAEWLRTAKDDDTIKITLWIKEESTDFKPTRPLPGQITDPQEIDDFLKKVDQANAERVKKAVKPVVERLNSLGYTVETNTGAPIIFMTATKKFILELATWDEVLSIDRGDIVAVPL
ncbi:hypothetical protein A3C98_00585 [Candidatus Roizmanbacteria bacterium RIFCSPHIGHO2_02_FULL_37_15]|nr:MAG: hypothetical protein A2859_01295 [Candidatus Roizmanbacteria bacterium RIFCSPHIGHO2_01_FULL_37_16b]OGK22776.1 MAG: hypothetical protein A3C98_00585 [Candidatus Roizmanbacteria bacterium RIFCSPHIGHO2_02_FULL_37_15]